MIELRDYQREAVEAAERAWDAGLRRPAMVLPTGAGKTVVFAHVVARWLEHERRTGRHRRAVVLAHRHELVEQAAAKLSDVAHELRVGVVKAARNETLARAVVASVQTLASPMRRRQLLDVGLIVVDEAHHATAATYVAILDHFGALGGREDGALALGVTATMSRGDDSALGDIWEDVVFERSIAWMISHGWLVRPRGVRVRIAGLDLSRVRRTAGDYREGDLGRALEDALAPEAVASAMVEHVPPGSRPTILFAPTVRTAELFAETLREVGYGVAVVTGAMAAQERAQALQDFRDGRVQVLCNCMVLTEGTDLPMASCAVIARPTRHAGLYVQMVGRVLRLWPGKDDALVLDVVGASSRHGLTANIELFGESSALDALERVDDGAEQLDDDELTLDAIGDALGADDVDDPSWINGPITSEEVDLFHGSKSMWLRTRAGVWFLPAGGRYLAILRGAPYGHEGYNVAAVDQYRPGASSWVITGVSDLSYAMAYAEGDVTPTEMVTARRERAWRLRKPSEKQRALAARYGIALNGQTSGELSSLITVAHASYRIDPYLRPGVV